MTVEHEVAPRLAATTILVRARGSQPEVLLLKRGEHARFMPNAYVFPRGAIDASDESADIIELCAGLDDRAAASRLGLPSDGLRFFVAAVREAFEECGLLLAYGPTGEWVDLSILDEAHVREARLQISAGRLDLAALCETHGWRLAVDRLTFFSHWITPPGKLRFDTRFFLSLAPPRQHAFLVGDEMSGLVWRTAVEALAEHARHQLLLMFPTRAILKEIAACPDIDALFDYANRPRTIVPITPVLPREIAR
jgi:8-oxo-dGTP pyrophosphatase MutT (NUDIX family)